MRRNKAHNNVNGYTYPSIAIQMINFFDITKLRNPHMDSDGRFKLDKWNQNKNRISKNKKSFFHN